MIGKRISICTLFQTNEWTALATKGAQATLETVGAQVTVTDAFGDLQRQAEDLLNLVSSKPDLIILALGDNAMFQKSIEAAAEAGIPIIDVEAAITGKNVITHLWADQMVNGIYGANNLIEYFAAINNGVVKGKLVEVYSPGLTTIDIRREACLMKLALYPDIETTEVPYDMINGVEDSQKKAEAYLLANPDVGVITAYYGAPMVGSALAVDYLGLNDKISILGIDAFEPVLNLMRQGKPILSAVQQDGYAIGVVAAKLAMKHFAGEKLPYQTIMPLVSIYNHFPDNHFPGKKDNFPAEGGVSIPCPQSFKDAGLGWDY
ncbi:MAG: sugar ABC transporter substrate-binding protein [Actinobacteria bacterium]|nr:sugar ABC transporter substrate-binding protein [Actinomycetota bacterium]